MYELGLVCNQTQLCHISVFIDYIELLHISAFTGHLQGVLREQTVVKKTHHTGAQTNMHIQCNNIYAYNNEKGNTCYGPDKVP